MKERLIEKLKDRKVKNKIVEITAKAYAAVFDIFNQIDPEKITKTTIAYCGVWDGSDGPFPFGYDISDINMDSEGPVFGGIHPEYEIPFETKQRNRYFEQFLAHFSLMNY